MSKEELQKAVDKAQTKRLIFEWLLREAIIMEGKR